MYPAFQEFRNTLYWLTIESITEPPPNFFGAPIKNVDIQCCFIMTLALNKIIIINKKITYQESQLYNKFAVIITQ